MATTEDAVLDRIRDVLVDELEFVEAPGGDFTRVPAGAQEGAFTVAYRGDQPIGGLGLFEEGRGTVLVSVMRPIREDFAAARRAALQDGRAVINAIVRDGAQVSGEYAVDDAGRSLEIEHPSGANYVVARVGLPLNFEATL